MNGRDLKKWRTALEKKSNTLIICPTCKEPKKKTDFSWAPSYIGNRKPACKQCEAYVKTAGMLIKALGTNENKNR